MTIDLGFAWLTLPGGQRVSVVDVPGHERFIKNMLAGVGGIDAALLVIAADEGPMPQTDEHLAILDLLGVDRGVVVLTKVDAVDADWLDLVREEVRERMAESSLARLPDCRRLRPHRRGTSRAARRTPGDVLATLPGKPHANCASLAGRSRLFRRRVRNRRHRDAQRRQHHALGTSCGCTHTTVGCGCEACKAIRKR